jgi:hypothetical protein
MIVSSPMNEEELRNLMYTAQLETTNLPFKKIEFLNCDSNEVYIVPVSKKLNTPACKLLKPPTKK